MAHKDIALMAHLMRRAGFGAFQDELEAYCTKGYEAVVEELLHPEDAPALEDDIIRRYHPDQNSLAHRVAAQANWVYRMINSMRPLEEKLALFWHGVFATGTSKLNHPKALVNQIDMFRRLGLGSFNTLLKELSTDPAMMYWLDNSESHKDAPNENYGRELLELFSMGVGNFTEEDVRQCTRAFTGWTIANVDYMALRASSASFWPYGRLDWQFQYRADDHDTNEKTFLGMTGPFNGYDIIDIICAHPATARFVATKLYGFFVSDDPDESAIGRLANEFTATKGDIRSVMRTLFRSKEFRSERIRFTKVKSPAEMVVGTARLTGDHKFPHWSITELALESAYMGQELLNPPSVEGWHSGAGWINTGSLIDRTNLAAKLVSDSNKPGVRLIIDRLKFQHDAKITDKLLDDCLNLIGPLKISQATRDHLIAHIRSSDCIAQDKNTHDSSFDEKMAELLQLIVATPEYQMA
jgi:uncharacterized protein (DUF1800 family)